MDDDYKHIVIAFKNKCAKNDNLYKKNVLMLCKKHILTIFSQPLNVHYLLTARKYMNHVDLIHIHAPNVIAYLAIMLFRSKTKYIVHWHSDILKNKFLKGLINYFEQYILKNASSIIVTSKKYAESSISLYNHASKINVLPIGVPREKSKNFVKENSPYLNIYNKHKDKKIVLYVGRFVKYKSLSKFVQSSVYLTENAIIYLVGDGPERKNIENMIKKYNLKDRVIILKKINDEELEYLYSKARVFCLPSETKSEAFGVVLIEAMKYGVPLVVNHIEGSGVNWVNKHNVTGYEIKNKKGKDFFDKVNYLISEDTIHQKFSQSSKDRFKNILH